MTSQQKWEQTLAMQRSLGYIEGGERASREYHHYVTSGFDEKRRPEANMPLSYNRLSEEKRAYWDGHGSGWRSALPRMR